MGLELVVGGLFFPAFVVGDGQFVGAGRRSAGSVMVDSRTISSPVPLPTRSGTSYSIDPGQVDDGQPALVEGVGDGVDVGQVRARRGRRPAAAPGGAPRIVGLISAVR